MGEFRPSRVANVALSLVREFLATKGLHTVLLTLDVEVPRGPHSISSRHSLAAVVGLRGRPARGRGSILEALLEKRLLEESDANPLEPRTDDSVPALQPEPDASESPTSSSEQQADDLSAEEAAVIETDLVVSNLLETQKELTENCDNIRDEPEPNAPPSPKIIISSACRTKLPIYKAPRPLMARPAPKEETADQIEEEETCAIVPEPVAWQGTRPLTLPSAMELKSVLLGSPEGQFFKEWRESELFVSADTFRDAAEGGISGVLAVVQAFVAKEMTFCRVLDREAAFVAAVAQILWQSGQHARARLAICGEEERLAGCGRYRRDGLTEAMLVLQLSSEEETRGAVQRHAEQLRAPGGLLLLVASLVLSKGLDEFRGRPPLLGKANACLVNLTLTGRLDMREAKQRAQVGLLCLAEHYGHLRVPSCLKTPRWPVWVLELGPDRYSVIVSSNAKLVADWRAELAFRLQIYDADGIKNAAITTGGELNEEEEKAASYLEMTIRTKWSGAQIQWLQN